MKIQGLLAAVLAVGLAGCGDDTPPPAANDDSTPAAEAPASDDADVADEASADPTDAAAEAGPAAPRVKPPPPVGPPIDADALALLASVDEHAVALGKLIESRSQTLPVKDFAKQLQAELAPDLVAIHKLQRQVGPVQHDDRVQALKQKQAAELTALTDTPDGRALDVAFLEAVAAGHGEATALIDGELLPAVRKDPVREHLGKLRATLAAQQEKAQAVLASF